MRCVTGIVFIPVVSSLLSFSGYGNVLMVDPTLHDPIKIMMHLSILGVSASLSNVKKLTLVFRARSVTLKISSNFRAKVLQIYLDAH